MSQEAFDWFPCNPTKLLGALSGMRSPKKLVYMIVLLRIYESGGACPDGLDAIAMRVGLNRRVVSDALDELFREERIYRATDGIRNPKADAVILESRAVRESRSRAGQEGATKRWKKPKQKQKESDSKPIAEPMANDAQLQIQDTLFPNGNSAPDNFPKAAESSVAMADPPRDAEADYYHRGKQVLGQSAGGMLRNLLRARGGNVALARAAIEQASTRGDARQYVGAMVRNGGDNASTRSGAAGGQAGFSALSADVRRRQMERGGHAGDPPRGATARPVGPGG